MNVELLKEFLEKISKNEKQYSIQPTLESLTSSMSTLASSPHDTNQQKAVADTLTQLDRAISAFEENFSPTEQERLRELNASTFFNRQLTQNIQTKIAQNAISPAVISEYLNNVSSNRRTYIDNIHTLLTSLNTIGIETEFPEDCDAEIGFQIPRDMFQNNLDGLIRELNAIKQIVRTFSEITQGFAEEIQVGQISTTNPLIFLSQSAGVILTLANTVSWGLDQWKKVEEIKHVRAQTVALQVFNDDKVAMFDDTIKQMIDEGIKEKTQELLAQSTADAGRKNELETALNQALESLLARLERGMVIELRVIDYDNTANTENESGNDTETSHTSVLEQIHHIDSTLSFPLPTQTPILQLPTPNKNTTPKTKQPDKAETQKKPQKAQVDDTLQK